jgi:ribosomal protein S18 acetylase RimI-like enzyme
MKYANSHKNKRFVIEGIWIYCGSDLDHYFSPKDFKDYAFYIKGTSALISHIRMAKRDAVKKSGLKKIGTFIKLSILYQGYYINSEKRLKVFRDYFKQLLSEECLQAFLSESSSSKFQYIDLKDSRVDDYMNKSSQSNYWKKYSSYHKSNSRGEIVIDSENDELAGYIFVKNKKSGEDGYITPLFVIKKYRKNGLSHQLADDAVKKYKATDLLVKKDNKIAINLYKKHGFVIVEHNDNRYKDYYYMKLKSKLNNNDKVYKKEGK